MIPLTQGQFALVDDDDFEWLSRYKWAAYCALKRTHKKHCYYAYRGTRNGDKVQSHFMHRVILNAPTGVLVDHRDGNGLNNQRANLRLCTRTQNIHNTATQRNSKSGLKGVLQSPSGLWRAVICIGTFRTRELAAAAYNEAAKQLRGEFAYLNKL
jgi:hypothetical protein